MSLQTATQSLYSKMIKINPHKYKTSQLDSKILFSLTILAAGIKSMENFPSFSY